MHAVEVLLGGHAGFAQVALQVETLVGVGHQVGGLVQVGALPDFLLPVHGLDHLPVRVRVAHLEQGGGQLVPHRVVLVGGDTAPWVAAGVVDVEATGDEGEGPRCFGDGGELGLALQGQPALPLQPEVGVDLLVQVAEAVVRYQGQGRLLGQFVGYLAHQLVGALVEGQEATTVLGHRLFGDLDGWCWLGPGVGAGVACWAAVCAVTLLSQGVELMEEVHQPVGLHDMDVDVVIASLVQQAVQDPESHLQGVVQLVQHLRSVLSGQPGVHVHHVAHALEPLGELRRMGHALQLGAQEAGDEYAVDPPGGIGLGDVDGRHLPSCVAQGLPDGCALEVGAGGDVVVVGVGLKVHEALDVVAAGSQAGLIRCPGHR